MARRSWTKRKVLLAVLGACLWKRCALQSFVPGWQNASRSLPASARASEASAASAASVSADAPGEFLESETMWKGVSMFNAMMWGGSIVSSKAGIDALASAGVEEPGVVFGALRFFVATLCLSPWLFASSTKESTLGSMKVGACYGAGYVAMFLALGLGTTAAKTSFFGSLQAVVCAGITCILARQLKIGTLAAAALAVTGVGVLELAGSGPLELAPGDLICSLVPLSFGAGWFILGKTMKDYPEDALPSTALQLALICLACLGWTGASSFHQGGLEAVAAVFAQLPSLLLTPNLLPPLLFSALVGNVLTMWLANEALRRVKGADVALIAASEPLWAALAGIAFLGDVLHPHEVVGGALLIAAVVCNELWAEEELPLESPARRRESRPRPLVQMAAMKDK